MSWSHALQAAHSVQVTQRLLDTYWQSWCADTQLLLGQLPAALQQPSDPAVAGTFERWLLELKARPSS